MVLVDPAEGKVIDVNPAACSFYGLTADQMRGRRVSEFSISPEAEVMERLRALEAGTLTLFRSRHRVGSGAVRDVEVCAGPVETVAGRVLHCIIQDITERLHAEEEVRRRELILAGIAEAGEALLSEKDLGSSMRLALAALGRAVRTDRVYVFEVQADAADGGTANLCHLWTAGDTVPAVDAPGLQPIPLGHPFADWIQAMAAGDPVHGPLRELSLSLRDAFAPEGLLSILLCPIQVGTSFWGFVGFGDRQWERRWQPTEIDAIRAAAGPIGNTIIRSRTEQQLRHSEERYRSWIENQGEGVGLVNPDEVFLFANPAAHEVFGVPPGRLVGRALSEFVSEQSLAFIQAETGKRRRGERGAYELEIRRPNGDACFLAVTTTPHFDNHGRFAGAYGVFRNVTDRVRAEAALQRERDFALQITTLMADGLTVTDATGRFTYVNPAFARMLGREPADVKGRPARDFVVAEDHPSLAEFIARRQRGETSIVEFRFQRPDGTVVRGSVTGVPRWENGRVVGAIASVTDVTERRQSEERLQTTLAELERFNRMMVNREVRVIELKREVNQILSESGRPATYASVDVDLPMESAPN